MGSMHDPTGSDEFDERAQKAFWKAFEDHEDMQDREAQVQAIIIATEKRLIDTLAPHSELATYFQGMIVDNPNRSLAESALDISDKLFELEEHNSDDSEQIADLVAKDNFARSISYIAEDIVMTDTSPHREKIDVQFEVLQSATLTKEEKDNICRVLDDMVEGPSIRDATPAELLDRYDQYQALHAELSGASGEMVLYDRARKVVSASIGAELPHDCRAAISTIAQAAIALYKHGDAGELLEVARDQLSPMDTHISGELIARALHAVEEKLLRPT